MNKAANDVLAERQRQLAVENWTDSHDDAHVSGSLAVAAACYALSTTAVYTECNTHLAGRYIAASNEFWPWDWVWWKPKNHRRDLVRAAALLIAEIERLDREELKKKPPPKHYSDIGGWE